jgi:hypothetical protein
MNVGVESGSKASKENWKGPLKVTELKTKLRAMSPMWDEFEKGVIDSVIAPRGIGKSFSQHAAEVSGKAAH